MYKERDTDYESELRGSLFSVLISMQLAVVAFVSYINKLNRKRNLFSGDKGKITAALI